MGRSLRLVTLSIISVLATTACAADIIAQYDGGNTDTSLALTSTHAAAQAFAVNGAHTVTEIQVKLYRWTGTAGNVLCELHADSNGLPASAASATVTKPITQVSDWLPNEPECWISFVLLDGGALVTSGRWWIVMKLSSQSDGNIGWLAKDGNQYYDGNSTRASFDGGGTWTKILDADAYFKVFGTSGPVDTTTTVTATPASVTIGGATTIEATVRGPGGVAVDGPGEVTFTAPDGNFDGGGLSKTLTLSGGKRSIGWTAPQNAGNRIITVNYSGHTYAGATYNPSAGSVTVPVNPADIQTKAEWIKPDSPSASRVTTRGTINVPVYVSHEDASHQILPVPCGSVSFSCTPGSGKFAQSNAALVNGFASTTWTAANNVGTFLLTISYSGCTQGTSTYRGSSVSENVQVDYTTMPTTATIRVSPDYPYVGARSFISVEVKDPSGMLVPGGIVEFDAPASGVLDPSWFQIHQGTNWTTYYPGASPGDVTIDARYLGHHGGGNYYLPATVSGVAHVVTDTDDGGSARTLMLEWNTDYPSASWCSKLKGPGQSARGLSDGLASVGWSADDYHNGTAWQKHFKKSPGLEEHYVDRHDLTFFSGHGSSTSIYFTTTKDSHEFDAGGATGAWGNKDCEWLCLSACLTMSDKDHWYDAMNGAHALCGYETVSYDTTTLGACLYRWLTKVGECDEPHTLQQSWFLAADEQTAPYQRAAVLAEDVPTLGDHAWGEGYIANDPPHDGGYLSVSHEPASIVAPGAEAGGAGGAYFATVGRPLQLDASGTQGSGRGVYLWYVWDCQVNTNTDAGDHDRDGVDEADDDCDARGPRATYVWHAPGAYTIRLIVWNENGQVSADTALVQVGVLVGDASGQATRRRAASEEDIEIVDNYPSLPDEVMLRTFQVGDTNLSYSEMMSVATYWGMTGSAGLDGDNWNMVDGSKELVVNQRSNGLVYLDRDAAYRYTHPPGAGLPPVARSIALAEQFLNDSAISRAEAVVEMLRDTVFEIRQSGLRAPVQSTPFQRAVIYRRTFDCMGRSYKACGPGGKMIVNLDEYGDVILFMKIWREAEPGDYVQLHPSPVAIADFHRLGTSALIGGEVVPAGCRRILINNVSIGYHEEGFSTAQSTIRPVYALDITCQDDDGSVDIQALLPASATPAEASVTSPSDGSHYSYNDEVSFAGTAAGGKPPYAYEWRSDKDGLLGTSPTFSRANLSVSHIEGEAAEHTISLIVTDSEGWTASDSVRIVVHPVAWGSVKLNEDYAPVAVLGRVTGSYPDFYYIEAPDRSSGIRVHGDPAPVEDWDVAVRGVLGTINSERCITQATTEYSGQGGPIRPLCASIRWIGGGDLRDDSEIVRQAGVEGGIGLNTIGLLMRATGSVTAVHTDGTPRFVLDDGGPYPLVCIPREAASMPSVNEWVSVTGISSIGFAPAWDASRVLILK